MRMCGCVSQNHVRALHKAMIRRHQMEALRWREREKKNTHLAHLVVITPSRQV